MLKFAELCVNLHPKLKLTLIMKRLKTICMMLMTIVVLSSCLKSNDQTTTLYDDAVITSFSLGTLVRYIHTTSSTGTDSVYTKSVSGGRYDFHIDQISRRIYNTDSLPIGTSVDRVLCNISTLNSGVIFLKDIDSTVYNYYSSSDSIDFSKPRIFGVISTDGSTYTEYEVSVNVHQEEGELFNWTLTDSTWVSPEAEHIELPQGIKQLIGSCTTEMYALSDDNKLMVSRDKGVTWQEDLLDEDASMLPVQDLSMTCYPMTFSDSTDYVVLVGNRSVDEYPQESIAMVWRKIVDYSKNGPVGRWVYMERTDNNSLALPRMQNLSIVKYDDGILAFGGAGIGGANTSPWSKIYQSRDNGITWKQNSLYQMPADFDTNATTVDVTVDNNQYLWLHCHGSGQVWRGKLNRLGWDRYSK